MSTDMVELVVGCTHVTFTNLMGGGRPGYHGIKTIFLTLDATCVRNMAITLGSFDSLSGICFLRKMLTSIHVRKI